jgi:hypothetical protein
LLTAIGFAVEVGDQVVVQVRQAEVRSAPGFLSRVVSVVQYEAAGTVTEVRADWAKVSFADLGVEGWVHSSALLEPQSGGLLAGGSRSNRRTTSTDEIALAGRGFNSAVEAQYQSDSGLDFSRVDAMEENAGLPIEQLGEFLATADLGLGEVEE